MRRHYNPKMNLLQSLYNIKLLNSITLKQYILMASMFSPISFELVN